MASAFETSADLLGQSADLYSELAGGADTAGHALGGQLAGMLPGQVTQDKVTAGSYGPTDIGSAIYGSLNDYIDPYYKEVMDAALGRMGDTHQQNLNAAGAAAENAGAYGGARHALQEAALTDDYMRSSGELAGQLSSQAFNNALSSAMNVQNMELNRGQYLTGLQAQLDQSKASFDANAALQLGTLAPQLYGQGYQMGSGTNSGNVATAASGLGNLGSTYYNIGTGINSQLASQGQQQQSLIQQIMSGADDTFKQYLNDPYKAMDLMAAMFGGDPRRGNVTSNSTQTSTPGIFDYLSLGLGTWGALA